MHTLIFTNTVIEEWGHTNHSEGEAPIESQEPLVVVDAREGVQHTPVGRLPVVLGNETCFYHLQRVCGEGSSYSC